MADKNDFIFVQLVFVLANEKVELSRLFIFLFVLQKEHR